MAVQEITSPIIYKGTDFSVSFVIDQFNGEPLQLAGYQAVAKIRKHSTSSSYKSFQTSISESLGRIFLTMSKEDTIELKAGRNCFDVLIFNEFETIKVIKGTMMVEETVAI
jgi:hypothetical protein